MIAFLDASALIYLIEGEPALARRVRTGIEAARRGAAEFQIALSRLSWLECRVRPARLAERDVLVAYDGFFAQPDLQWIELSREVVEHAAALRIAHGLRTPDALQAACCLQTGREHRFLTGDAAFAKVAGLRVVRIKP